MQRLLITLIALALVGGALLWLTKYNHDRKELMEAPQVADETERPLPPQNAFTSPAGAEVTLSDLVGGDTISSPATFSGTVPANWVFEGVVPIELRSTDGEVITEWYGEATWLDADGDPIEGAVTFTTTLAFDTTEPSLVDGGVIAIMKNVVAEEDVADEITFPVVIVADGEEGQDAPGSIPDGLSHVEAGMVDYASCAAGGGEIIGASCTTFDGRVFDNDATVRYVCTDETELEVAYTEGAVEYSENGQEFVTLNEVVAGSGERYSNGTITFHAKADEATVSVNDEVVLTGCVAQN